MNNKGLILDFLKERTAVIQIIVTGILLSIGVRFFGAGISEICGLNKWSNILIGIAIIIIASLFFVFKLYSVKTKKLSIRGSVFYDKTKQEIVDVPEYAFANKISKDLKSAFHEDKALEKSWKKYPLDNFENSNEVNSANNLLLQETEYYFLNKLSLHLMAFFISEMSSKKSKLVNFQREDISKILFKNSFLDLFSRPQEKREAFIDKISTTSKEDSDIKLISSSFDGYQFIIIP